MTELSRRGTVWSYTDAQYQPPPPYIPATDPYEPFALAAVELPEGIVVLGQLAEGHGVDDVRVGSEVELVVETLYTDESGDRTIWRWLPLTSGHRSSSARRRTSERRQRRRRARRGHAPVGQVGPQLRQLWRARGARGAAGLRRRLGGRRPDRRRRDRAQRLRRVRRRRHLRPGARLERRARRHVVRRVRHWCAGPRHRARPHPRRAQRGGAGRRCGHHPQGLPRAQRGGAVGRPGLAALPAARDDQPRLLRALRAPPDGPVRRDAGRLRRGEGEERPPRAEQPQRALPQGGAVPRTC